jgi:hypothetical protein
VKARHSPKAYHQPRAVAARAEWKQAIRAAVRDELEQLRLSRETVGTRQRRWRRR